MGAPAVTTAWLAPAESDWDSVMETRHVLRTHGGARLLASAQDARAGCVEAHVLLDPDGEESL